MISHTCCFPFVIIISKKTFPGERTHKTRRVNTRLRDFATGVSISKFSRCGRVAAWPQNKFLSTYSCGQICMATTPNKTPNPYCRVPIVCNPPNHPRIFKKLSKESEFKKSIHHNPLSHLYNRKIIILKFSSLIG